MTALVARDAPHILPTTLPAADDYQQQVLRRIQRHLQHHFPCPRFQLSITWRENAANTDSLFVLLFGVPMPERARFPLPPPFNVLQFAVSFIFADTDIHPLSAEPPPPIQSGDVPRIKQWYNRMQLRCLRHSNVVAVFPGYPRLTDVDEWSSTLHWLVIVHHKGYVPWGESPVPDSFGGIPTKLYNGRLRSLADNPNYDEFNYSRPDGPIDMLDPVQPGASIAELNGRQIGTLGCFLSSSSRPSSGVDLLTNWHVIPRGATVVQPAMGDFRRAEIRRYKGQIINAKRLKPAGWQASVTADEAALAVLNAHEYHWSAEDAEHATISRRQSCHYKGMQGNHAFSVNGREMLVGVDAARLRYTSGAGRAIEPCPELEHAARFRLLHEVVCLASVHDLRQSEDAVVKVGRTTGERWGFPLPFTALTVRRREGDFEVTDEDESTYLARVQHTTRDQHRVVLHNQYLIGHKLGVDDNPLFALGGDSGAVCWLHSGERRSVLRPWGLLNAGLTTELYSYGVASPLDAVLDAVKHDENEELSVLAQDNAT